MCICSTIVLAPLLASDVHLARLYKCEFILAESLKGAQPASTALLSQHPLLESCSKAALLR